MRKIHYFLTVAVFVFFHPRSVIGASEQPTPSGYIHEMPFARKEADFYNQPFPIRESHSLYALVLFGSVLLLIIGIFVWKMLRTPPRQTPKK